MSAATELRHITSNSALARHSHQHAHSPARSPTSIPSSPTSVHSSSSAIFERDIEPLSPPSPQTHLISPTNAHRIPRSKTTETIEHSVPSVLDSAAAILASIQNANDIAIVAPAPFPTTFAGSGFASPIGSFRSRSPSPTIGSLTAHGHGRNSLLLSIPQQQQQAGVPSSPPAAAAVRPTIQTSNVQPAPPAIVTPTSAYFSVAEDGSDVGSITAPSVESSEETTRTALEPPTSTLTPPPTAPPSLPALSPAHSLSFSPQHHSPVSVSVSASPSAASASKRLSFISYADLLTSTPTSTVPLSQLTTAASASEPPPHIVGGTHPTTASAATSLRGFPISPASAHGHAPHDVSGSPNAHARDRESAALALMGPSHPNTLDDLGGEWEREGLGRGLAERLDVLYGTAHA